MKMSNSEALLNGLKVVFDGLLSSSIDPLVAAEANNTADKIIRMLVVQINYNHLRCETPEITFLQPPTDARKSVRIPGEED